MWKLTEFERNIFYKVLDDSLKKNNCNESLNDILNKKINTLNKSDGLTINEIIKVC